MKKGLKRAIEFIAISCIILTASNIFALQPDRKVYDSYGRSYDLYLVKSKMALRIPDANTVSAMLGEQHEISANSLLAQGFDVKLSSNETGLVNVDLNDAAAQKFDDLEGIFLGHPKVSRVYRSYQTQDGHYVVAGNDIYVVTDSTKAIDSIFATYSNCHPEILWKSVRSTVYIIGFDQRGGCKVENIAAELRANKIIDRTDVFWNYTLDAYGPADEPYYSAQ